MNRDAAQARPASSTTVVTLVIAAAMFILFLDGAIITTSLPQMAHDLGVRPVDMNLGLTAYMLAVAVVAPVSAWAADRVGAKTLFISAMLLFTAASVGCAAATSLPLFVLARVAQGVAGAVLLPVGRAIGIRNAKPTELMQVSSLLTWPALSAPVIGPVIGGAITSMIGWRWNFLLNLPLGLVGAILAAALIPASGERVRKPLDLVGAALTGGALFLLVFALDEIGEGGELLLGGGLLLTGGTLAVAAVLWLRRASHPLLDLTALKVATFAIPTLEGGSLLLIAISATPFLLPLMMQTAWGYGPLAAGGWLLVYFLGNLLMKSRTSFILRRWGFRRVMVANGLIVGATIAACGVLRPSTAHPLVALVLFAAGATRSMQMTTINTLAFADVRSERRGSASTLFSVLQQLCLATGVAVGALLLNAAKAAHGAAVLTQDDFQLAFLACGAAGAVGALLCLRLHAGAGAEVSGHAPAGASPGGPAPAREAVAAGASSERRRGD